MTDKLERVELALRVLKEAREVGLSTQELSEVRRIALVYLDAELGIEKGGSSA